MSPRAAWQLEEMGFGDVSDFVDGKIEWISHGLPLEGTGPHFAVAGEIADRDAVLACRIGDRLGDVARALETVPHDYCVCSTTTTSCWAACASGTFTVPT